MLDDYKNKMMGLINGYKKKISIKALEFGIKNNPEYFNAKVTEVSTKITKDYIDAEMKKQGLIHCHFCNNRQQLVNISGTYLCKIHANMIKGGVKNG